MRVALICCQWETAAEAGMIFGVLAEQQQCATCFFSPQLSLITFKWSEHRAVFPWAGMENPEWIQSGVITEHLERREERPTSHPPQQTEYTSSFLHLRHIQAKIKTFITLPLSLILLSPVKKSTYLNQERNMHRSSIVHKQKQSSVVLNKYEDNREWTLSLEEEPLLLIIDLARITWRILWCCYQLFGLSFWRHPFTAEDPLLSKWCCATFLWIWSDKETNSSTSWMACERVFSTFLCLGEHI